MRTLSKSDFKIGQNCLKKLWYKKQKYPSTDAGNEYLEMLADGGYMVGKMATLLFPDGVEITGSTPLAIESTDLLLKQDKIVLFEPAFLSKQKLIRIDVLHKDGDNVRLIEVKSKSFELSLALSDPNYFRKNGWREYIEDIAYQKWVLQEAYPNFNIECELLMPDKDKTTPIEGLISWFSIHVEENQGGFRKPEVTFNGDLDVLQSGHILSFVNVDDVVDEIMDEVQSSALLMLNALEEDKPAAFYSPISITCRDCEYRLKDETLPNGFKECWGSMADPEPHILELGYLGNVNRRKEYKDGINELIRNGKSALSDVPVEYLSSDDKPYYNNRPLYQRTCLEEFILPEFKEAISKLEYPLYFIDFETSQMAIPYHAGMRPYGKVLFQWSCHTIEKEGAEPLHSEWINVEETYPNRAFAHSLMRQIGDKGTVMTWSAYENTQLRDLKQELEEQDVLDSDEKKLLQWLKIVIKEHAEDETRICDMNQLALKYYFHPMMGGRTSIKVTLPAVLSASRSSRIRHWLESEQLFQLSESGVPKDPYGLLPHIEIIDKAEKVKDGSGAMRAYQDMLYGIHRDSDDIRNKYREALLRYCKLDTLAMVVIWERWREMLNDE